MVSSIMKFSVLAAFCAAANAIVVPRQNAIPSAAQIAALAPDLGAFPNTNPNKFGDCDGPRQANGQIPRVPCQCPPTHDAYIAALTADVLAGHAVNNTVVKVTFPTGSSAQDKHGRITAAIIALQNLNGPGKGCPGVSTTLGIQSNNIDKCGDFFCGDEPASSSSSSSAAAAPTSAPPVAQPAPSQAPVNVAEASTVTVTSIKVVTSIITVTAGETPASTPPAATNTQAAAAPPVSSSAAAPPPPAAATTSAAVGNGQLTRDLVDQLAPQLGSHPNNNPNASGDCDGPAQPDGSIKKVPCACPPERPAFIDALFADIQAGHAIHNPTVKVDFPTSSSKADQHARINAATIALQNLNGPGQGCPFVSTTFGAQSNAIGN